MVDARSFPLTEDTFQRITQQINISKMETQPPEKGIVKITH
jgi:hypothetical protein